MSEDGFAEYRRAVQVRARRARKNTALDIGRGLLEVEGPGGLGAKASSRIRTLAPAFALALALALLDPPT